MATITMDASEYEALKKNISLLEEAKKKEVELSDEIKQLQQEKIQALKDAQHNVTIIKRSVKNELIYSRRNPSEIFSLLRQYFASGTLYRYPESSELDHIINICFQNHNLTLLPSIWEAFFIRVGVHTRFSSMNSHTSCTISIHISWIIQLISTR